MALTKIDDRGLKTPIDLLDNEKIRLGTGNDLELYHDATDSHLDNNTGDLYLTTTGSGDDINITSADDVVIKTNGGTQAIVAVGGAESKLYHNGSKKLETTSEGVTLRGTVHRVETLLRPYAGVDVDLGTDGDRWRNIYVYNAVDLKDDGKLRMGDSDDLQIYHSGANSVIDNTTGELQIATDAVMRFQATEYKFNNAANSEKIANFFQDGACELYHNHSKKFETDSGGVTVTDGNASVHLKLVSSSGTAGYFYGSGNTNVGFLDAGGNWAIQHVKDTHTTFSDTNASRLRIDSDGIKFGSDTAAANALDDYEEGTFTPRFQTSNGNWGGSMSSQNGSYTKIGNVVHVTFRLHWGSVSGSGNFRITALPFTIANVTSNQGSPAIGVRSGFNYARLTGYWLQNTEQFQFQYVDSSGSNGSFDLSVGALASTGYVYCSGWYQTA